MQLNQNCEMKIIIIVNYRAKNKNQNIGLISFMDYCIQTNYYFIKFKG